MLTIESVDHIAFAVRDTEKSAEWYTRVFDMQRIYEDVWTGLGDPIALCNGIACVALFRNRFHEPLREEPEHANRHFAFRVDEQNLTFIRQRLKEMDIEFKERDHKVCTSLYLNDPDGYQIEVTHYYK